MVTEAVAEVAVVAVAAVAVRSSNLDLVEASVMARKLSR